MRNEFEKAIVENQAAFGLDLSVGTIERLAEYHRVLNDDNALLHLVAPCSPAEFATRHVLESLTLLKHLPHGASFADVGSGGGLPAIPCLIAREDLKGRLIESKEKKADFLSRALERMELGGRSEVIAKQFSETEPGDARSVTCRALDKFSERVPGLIKWSEGRSLLLFGGEHLGQKIKESGISAVSELMPLSERRFLFVAEARG